MRFINTLFTALLLSTGFTAHAAAVPAATSLTNLDDVLSSLPADTSTSELNPIFAHAAAVPAATSLSDLDDVLSSLPVDTPASKLNAIFAARAVALYCGTKGSSPTVVDTHEAANRLIENKPSPVECIQTNMNPELGIIPCTQMVSHKSAQLRICGNPGQRVKCVTAGWAAKHIANNCKIASTGRAEGYYIFEAAKCRISVR